MVEKKFELWANSLNELIIHFFRENLPSFSLKNKTIYGPYWGVAFIDSHGVEVRLRGENDGFDIVIKIDNEEFPLWQFDKNVNNATDASEQNILYQLSILKTFFNDAYK